MAGRGGLEPDQLVGRPRTLDGWLASGSCYLVTGFSNTKQSSAAPRKPLEALHERTHGRAPRNYTRSRRHPANRWGYLRRRALWPV